MPIRSAVQSLLQKRKGSPNSLIGGATHAEPLRVYASLMIGLEMPELPETQGNLDKIL